MGLQYDHVMGPKSKQGVSGGVKDMSETFAFARGEKPKFYARGKHFSPDKTTMLHTVVLCRLSTPFGYTVPGKQRELRAVSPEPVTICLPVLTCITPAEPSEHRPPPSTGAPYRSIAAF